MKKILFVDCLTTGMNTERCAIYNLSGIYTEDGVEVKRIDLHIRPFPGARINDQSLWIGGVNRATVAAYPEQEKGFQTLIEFLDQCVDVRNSHDKIYIAGFNSAAFDMPFLWELFRRNGNERFRNYFHMQVLDVMSVAAFGLLDKRRAMPDFKLESVARELGIEPDTQTVGNGLQNARTSLEIFWKLQQNFGLWEFSDFSEAEQTVKNY